MIPFNAKLSSALTEAEYKVEQGLPIWAVVKSNLELIIFGEREMAFTTEQKIKTCIDAAIEKMDDLGVALSECRQREAREHAAEVFGAVVMLREWQDAIRRESVK
ncbi:MAG: hypothetical protein DRJ64_06630 [Thermoprotei archaeon]|nr:MAG: hypothetical protein DRJ64_06630 [Thermoprotei archaeon]